MPSFNIFLPAELYRKCVEDARRHGTSLSRWIREIVEKYYEEAK